MLRKCSTVRKSVGSGCSNTAAVEFFITGERLVKSPSEQNIICYCSPNGCNTTPWHELDSYNSLSGSEHSTLGATPNPGINGEVTSFSVVQSSTIQRDSEELTTTSDRFTVKVQKNNNQTKNSNKQHETDRENTAHRVTKCQTDIIVIVSLILKLGVTK